MGATGTRASGADSVVWLGVAVLLLASLVTWTFRPVLAAGVTTSVPSLPGELPGIEVPDIRFEAWLVGRNAETITHDPLRLFDTPHCAPAEKTLTLGVHMIAMSLFAVPVSLLTSSSAAAFDWAIAVMLLVSGVAMYGLVYDWTGSRAAGLVAAVLYALGPMRIGNNITHPSVWDSSGLVLALFFARRLFAEGRWRDAVGLGGACALQIAASFYPLVAAAFFAPPFVVWLLARYGLRKVRVSQLAVVAAAVVATAAVVLGPYLEMSHSADTLRRTQAEFAFARPIQLLPGRPLFLGWSALLLAALGLGRRPAGTAARLGGDPRWALAAGAVLVTTIAVGSVPNEFLHQAWPSVPFSLPDAHALLARVVPGLDAIRVIFRLWVATQVVVCIFAGLGAAKLVERAGSAHRTAASAGLVSLAILVHLVTTPPWTPLEVRVSKQARGFFATLEALGNEGAILELPILQGTVGRINVPGYIMASTRNGRRSSACFGSYPPPGLEVMRSEAERLPAPDAVRALRAMGFTTLVVHHPPARAHAPPPFEKKLRRARNPQVKLLLAGETMTAYSLGDGSSRGD